MVKKRKIKRESCPRFLQSGHSAFFKRKSNANRCLKKFKKDPKLDDAKVKKTTHTLRGKGWLLYR